MSKFVPIQKPWSPKFKNPEDAYQGLHYEFKKYKNRYLKKYKGKL